MCNFVIGQGESMKKFTARHKMQMKLGSAVSWSQVPASNSTDNLHVEKKVQICEHYKLILSTVFSCAQ